jgi:tetratricopeptide (TPR) repeat protein
MADGFCGALFGTVVGTGDQNHSISPFHYHEPMNTLLSPIATPPVPAVHVARALRSLVGTSLIVLASGALAQAPTNAQAARATAPAPAPALNSNLNAPLFYQLLLGEINVRDGDPGAGYSLILDAARKQRDGQLYRRAVDVALQARSGDAALTAAQAWAQALPESLDAQRYVLQILLALNRAGETAPVLRAILERSPASERNDIIHGIPQAFARVSDKALALRVVREALASHQKQPDNAAAAWTTVGRLELALDQLPQALVSAKGAHEADPSSPFPALLALELMGRGQADAEALVRSHLLKAKPGAPEAPSVALAYARFLLDQQRNAEARTQLTSLTTQQPDLAEPWLLLATLQVQENALPAASDALQKYMTLARQSGDDRSQRGLTQAYLLMADIAEKRKDFAAANAWLDRIENADEIMAAQMRRASLLARQGQLAQARALLRNHPERRPGDARLKLAAEASLLRDMKAWQQAYDVYAEATARFPEDTDLIYDQAMMAEKLDQLDTMERLLRRLIVLKPDHHHAYNALGYSLADRNLRLPEAKQLIEKALSMAPGDAYIQDSLGWVEFRMGNTARALSILQAAYGKRPDAEIAAHLGEVLWVSGQREEALKIWREGLLLASDNETLQSTLKRLRVNP